MCELLSDDFIHKKKVARWPAFWKFLTDDPGWGGGVVWPPEWWDWIDGGFETPWDDEMFLKLLEDWRKDEYTWVYSFPRATPWKALIGMWSQRFLVNVKNSLSSRQTYEFTHPDLSDRFLIKDDSKNPVKGLVVDFSWPWSLLFPDDLMPEDCLIRRKFPLQDKEATWRITTSEWFIACYDHVKYHPPRVRFAWSQDLEQTLDAVTDQKLLQWFSKNITLTWLDDISGIDLLARIVFSNANYYAADGYSFYFDFEDEALSRYQLNYFCGNRNLYTKE